MLVKTNPRARLWLFDFDNTIAALAPEVDWAAGRRELEAYLRGEGVPEAIFSAIPRGNLLLYEAVRARLATGESLHDRQLPISANCHLKGDWGPGGATLLAEASSIIARYELAGVDRAESTPGALELLEVLVTRGAAVIIVTSNSSRTVARWLDQHRAARLVSAIVGRDTMLALKPSPGMVIHALELHRTAPSETVFVGDSEADWGAATAAGVGFYGIATTAVRRDRLIAAGASEIFASPSALRIYLNFGEATNETGRKDG
jgi:phosphoglycolate phosphatase-like HAD superfamily hydrolase